MIIRAKYARIIVLLVLFSGFPLQLFCKSPAQESQSPYTQDCYGLEHEFEAFLNAYSASDPTAPQKLSIFVIPDAEKFYAAHFPADKVTDVLNDNNKDVQRATDLMMAMRKFWPRDTHFQMSCKKWAGSTNPNLHPRADAIQPTAEIAVEQFEITYLADADQILNAGGRTFTNLSNFIYIDGAYRFVGQGAYPSWLMTKPPANPFTAISMPVLQSSYKNNSAGLKQLMEAALSLAQKGNDAALLDLTKTMILPDPDGFFARVFGPEPGGAYGSRYTWEYQNAMAARLSSLFKNLAMRKVTRVDVTRFTDACVGEADETEYPLLMSRRDNEPLSDVLFTSSNGTQLLRYFAYVDGGFRFLENLPANWRPPLVATQRSPIREGHPSGRKSARRRFEPAW